MHACLLWAYPEVSCISAARPQLLRSPCCPVLQQDTLPEVLWPCRVARGCLKIALLCYAAPQLHSWWLCWDALCAAP